MLPKAHIPPNLRAVPIGPTVERWREMTLAEREQFMMDLNEALKGEQLVMSEGRPHKKAKSRALDILTDQDAIELYDTAHVIRRLQGIMENLESRANTADVRFDKALSVTRKAILQLLETRGIRLSLAGLSKLDACTDPEELDALLTRTLSATSESEFFDVSHR